MKSDLETSKALTKDLIKQTNTMQRERDRLEVHKQIAQAFLARFQLSGAEHQLLYGAAKDSPIVADFFRVLDRVQSIHADCRLLMQCGYQTAAIDIMEEMTLHQEGALERLYRWTQNHCRSLENNEIGPLIVEAMSRLQDRPVLFKCVHFVDFPVAFIKVIPLQIRHWRIRHCEKSGFGASVHWGLDGRGSWREPQAHWAACPRSEEIYWRYVCVAASEHSHRKGEPIFAVQKVR